MRPKHDAAEERVRIAERSRAMLAARRHLEFSTVCLVGPVQPIPRFTGDNRGGLPVRVVLATRERDAQAARHYDTYNPYHRFVVLESVHVASKVQGERLKAALDLCLLGHQARLGNDMHKPRHRFRDVWGCWEDRDERAVWWGAMLDDAVAECVRGGSLTGLDIFGDEERIRRIAKAARNPRWRR